MVIEDCKVCSRCRRELSVDEFHRDPTKRSGRSSQCRDCKNGNEPVAGIPPMPAGAVLAINNWRGAQPGQLQGRAW